MTLYLSYPSSEFASPGLHWLWDEPGLLEPPLSELEGGSLAPWSLVPHISHEVENSELRNEQLGHSLTTIESRASGLRAWQMKHLDEPTLFSV